MAETDRQMAKRLVAQYGDKAIAKLARKGRDEPESLTPEEIQAVGALVWLRETGRMH